MKGWAIACGDRLVRGTLASTRREAWIAFNEFHNRWRLDWLDMLRKAKKRGYRAVRVDAAVLS